MKIRKLHVKNLRGVEEAVLEKCGDLIVIAGPNGSGKSTILDALNLWWKYFAHYGYDKWLNETDLIFTGKNEAFIEIEFCVSKEEISQAMKRGYGAADKASLDISAAVEYSRNSRDIRPNGNKTLLEILLGGKNNLFEGQTVLQYFSPNRHFNPLRVSKLEVDKLTRYSEYKTFLSPHIQDPTGEIKQKLYSIQFKSLQEIAEIVETAQRVKQTNISLDSFENPFAELRDMIIELLPYMALERVDITSNPFRIVFKLSNNVEVDFDDLSSGEKEVIGFASKIFSVVRKNAIVAIDEPELHLNGEVEKRIIPFIQKHLIEKLHCQVFLTTHSPNVISSAPDMCIYRMTYPSNGANQIEPMVGEDSDMLMTIKSLVGDLGIFTLGKRFVFIEGNDSKSDSDRKILEEIFPKMKNKVIFVPVGSSAAVKRVQQMINEALKQKIPFGEFYSLRDRDRLDESEVKELESIGNLRVWDRCMIENYFLDNKLLLETTRRIGMNLTENDIQKRVSDAVDEQSAEEVRLRIIETLEKRTHISWSKDICNFKCDLQNHVSVVQGVISALDKEIEAIRKEVCEEKRKSDYIKTFHGKKLLKKIINTLGVKISASEFLIAAARTAVEKNLVPSKMNEIIESLLNG